MLSTVDTLKLSKEFEDVGFTQAQAEKMAITYKNMQEGLATKEDIDNLKKDINKDIDNLKKDINTDIDNLKKDIDNLKKDINKDINHVKELLHSKINPLYWGMGLLVVITGGIFATMITLLINLL